MESLIQEKTNSEKQFTSECCENCCCCFTLATIFPCVYSHNSSNDFITSNYKGIFIMWIFGYLVFSTLTITNFFNEKIEHSKSVFNCVFFAPFLTFVLYISYGITYICLITPFIIISLVYPYFIDNILEFLVIHT